MLLHGSFYAGFARAFRQVEMSVQSIKPEKIAPQKNRQFSCCGAIFNFGPVQFNKISSLSDHGLYKKD